MTVIHHPALRVNSDVPEQTVEIWAEVGWELGPHPDTDPDFPDQVRPVADPVETPKPARKSREQE